MVEILTALLITAAALWATVDAITADENYCSEHAVDDRACVYGSDD